MLKVASLLAPALLLAACGGGGKEGEGNRSAAAATPTPASTLPPPRTPVMQVTPAPGATPAWLEPRADPAAPRRAPYGDLLDQPVVDAPARR